MKTVQGDNDVTFFVRATKPVEQVLDEKWFLWYSDDPELKWILQEKHKRTVRFTVLDAVETIKDFITNELYLMGDTPYQGIHNDILQMSLDFTDWEHLADRLCANFDVPLHKIPGDRFRKWYNHSIICDG